MIKIDNEIKWSRNHDACITCSSTEHRHKSKGYCVKCYPSHKHEIMPVALCSKCGRNMKGYRDRSTGAFICLSCRASKIKVCYICGKEKQIHTRIGNGVYVCENCSNHVNDGKCSHCRTTGKVLKRGDDRSICYACDSRPPAVCGICHTVVKFYKTSENGTVMCKKCYTPSAKKCIVCGKIKTPHKRTSKGHICEECYQRPLRECSACGDHRTGYKKTDDGKYLCRECYYTSLLEIEIGSERGTFTVEWAEKLFFEYIDDKRRVQSNEIVWKAVKRDKPLFEMLGVDFTCLSEITTDLFWARYHGMHRKRSGQLYAFLIDRGYISQSKMPSEDYQRHHRILSTIEAVPEGFRAHVRQYYDRFLAIREKKLSAGWKETDYGTGSYTTFDTIIIILNNFVGSLFDSGVTSFAEVTVDHVDNYIAGHFTYARVIKAFLLWLYQEQQVTWKYRGNWNELKYSTPNPIHEEKYNYLLDRFLDESYPLKESLICLLALIYGIRPKILRKIRIYDLSDRDDNLYLRLPYLEIMLHAEIAEKIRRYVQDSFLPNPFDIDNPYLFYGYTYKEPMDDGSIRNIFHKHGIRSSQVLPTVIHRLFVSKVRHPAILSKATGIHRMTAVRYFEAYNPSVLEEINLNKRLYGKIK